MMRHLVDLKILNRLDWLIRHKVTGTPNETAERLGISLRSFHEMKAYLIEEMKAPIRYNANRQSYVYEYPPKFYLGFERDTLEITEWKNTFDRIEENEQQWIEKKKKTIEVEIDDGDEILDNDIDFNELFN